MTKTYLELITLPTFEERFEYLRLKGVVGDETFGSLRYLNQEFYNSKEWQQIKDKIIDRDKGCDLGVPGLEIVGPIYVHHINPITPNDILMSSESLINPNNLISASDKTHKAIHYGDKSYIATLLHIQDVERKPRDTCPWADTSIFFKNKKG